MPKYMAEKVYYAWLTVGDDSVCVGDIEDDADETAIMQQLYAKGMGWA